ncbi:MAG: transglutaminase domain-containing protein [Candidatus Heimdallarchaeaceae archaeon]
MSAKEKKKLKRIKKPIKTKPAVTPKKTKKIKTKKKKSPITTFEEKKLKVKNIIFTLIFGVLLVASFFFKRIIAGLNPSQDLLTQTIIQLIQYFLIGLFTYVTLLAFETYKVEFHPKPLRILLTIVTAVVFFPLTLFKYYTRHNVWRIIFVGSTILSLLLTLFGSYMTGVFYRDSETGAVPDQYEIDTSFLSAPFIINLPIDIDSLMDLLDNLGELDDLTLQSSVANITAIDGSLGDYLYRWDVYDKYSEEEWDFEKSNQATLYNIPAEEQGTPSGFDDTTDARFRISQTVYTASSSVDISLLTTWNAFVRPHIEMQTNWGDSVKNLQGNSVGSSDTNVYFDLRDQLQLQSTVEKSDPLTPFQGTFEYETYFMSEDDMETLMQDTLKYNSLDQLYIQEHYSMFLQAPEGYYDTISTAVTTFADEEIGSSIDTTTEVYDVITTVIQNVLMKGDVENIFGGGGAVDTGGEDPANVLARNQPAPASAYISLTVMALRRLGIPARPVMGFAVGSGDSSYRELKVANMYYWIEALLPLDYDDDGSADEYRWGQFQVGPYPVDSSTFIYCENSLNAQYELNLQLFENTPGDVRTMESGGATAYLVDYGINYTIAVNVTRSGSPASGVPITLKSYKASEVQGGYDTSLLSSGTEIVSSPIVTNESGVATYSYVFTQDNYSILDFSNQAETSYFMVALNGLTNFDAKGIAIFPTGYLTDVVLNASVQNIPNPQNPAEIMHYYLIQQGWKYEMYSLLYRDGPPGNDPLANRTVTYYLLTPEQLQEIQGGAAIDPSQFTEIGQAKTDSIGNSSVLSVNATTSVDYFASLTVNTTYAVVALYGLNYSYAPIVIIDGLIASVKVNDTVLDTAVDGYTMWEEINVTLQMQPPNGVAEPLKNEDVWLWIVYDTDWQAYDGSVTGTEYNTTLTGTTRSKYIGHYITNSNGQLIKDYLIDATELGAGKFKIVAIYSERWEGSEDIFITIGPALNVQPEETNTNLNSQQRYHISSLLIFSETFIQISFSFLSSLVFVILLISSRINVAKSILMDESMIKRKVRKEKSRNKVIR